MLVKWKFVVLLRPSRIIEKVIYGRRHARFCDRRVDGLLNEPPRMEGILT